MVELFEKHLLATKFGSTLVVALQERKPALDQEPEHAAKDAFQARCIVERATAPGLEERFEEDLG